MHQPGILVAIAVIVGFIIFINRRAGSGIKSVNAASAQELLKHPDLLVLDVRTPNEFRQGHLKGAKLLPLSEIGMKISEISSWKDRQVLVYCRAGSRSTAACHILKKNGFNNLANLSGGITSWTGMGFKTVQGAKIV